MAQTLLEMTTDLVLAQIHAHRLFPEDMQAALHATYNSLFALHAQEASPGRGAVETPETPPAPLHWRKSITKHAVTCLACGARFKQLSVRHLRDHGLNGRSYRITYGMPLRQSLAARSVTARRRQIVQRSRPWEKAPTYRKAQEQVAQAAAKTTKPAPRKGTSRTKQ